MVGYKSKLKKEKEVGREEERKEGRGKRKRRKIGRKRKKKDKVFTCRLISYSPHTF